MTTVEKKLEAQGGFGFSWSDDEHRFEQRPKAILVQFPARGSPTAQLWPVPSLSGDEVILESKTIPVKTSQDIRRKLVFGKSQRILVRVSGKGSPSPTQLAISGKEGGAAGYGFDQKLQRRCSAKTNLVHSPLFRHSGRR
ncbi:hypothetical protein U1Q18_003808 [Sarracenia purpurea var. burkii]